MRKLFIFFLLIQYSSLGAQNKYATALTLESVKKVVNDAAQWQIEHMSTAGRNMAYNPQYTGWADGVFLGALADWAAFDNSHHFIEWYESIAQKLQWEAMLKAVQPDGMLGYVQPIGDAPQNVSAQKNDLRYSGIYVSRT
jgi:hypothetical protein